jgi:hypothetical protein
MLSVNQIAAQIKLTEMWKASNDPQFPIKMKTRERQENAITTRSLTRGDLDNSQKGNPRALQVNTHLGLAIQSKLMLEIC